MNINIPPDSRDWLFAPRSLDEGALWSLGRYEPKLKPSDMIVFRFDGVAVARAICHSILKPGDHDAVCHNGSRVLRGYKAVWLNSSFEDMRGKGWDPKPINTVQLAVLRRASDPMEGRMIKCDGSTEKALLKRGYAWLARSGNTYISEEGRKRSRKAADIHVVRDGFLDDPMLMQDLPLRKCRVCGCTDDDCSGCVKRTGYSCSWVEDDLCSACIPNSGDGRDQ